MDLLKRYHDKTPKPNNYHGDEDCVEKAYNMDGSGKWIDHQCNLQDRAHALCQIVK